MDQEKIKNEEFTEEDLDVLANLKYHNLDGYQEKMKEIKNGTSFEKIISELHEQKEDNHGRSR